MNPDQVWDEEKIATLKRHAGAGLTAREISEAMQITRNAAIGKMMRLGIPVMLSKRQPKPKPRPVANPAPVPANRVTRPVERRIQIRPGKNTERRSEIQTIEATEIIDLPPDTSPFACTIMELGSGMCRWPLSGNTRDMHYCGGPAVECGSWCGRHRRIVYGTGARR